MKKNYKGNLEALKRHKELTNYIEWNNLVEFQPGLKPEDTILAPLIQPRLGKKMRYLQISRLSTLGFRIGANLKLDTEFFPLRGAEDDDESYVDESKNTESEVTKSISGVNSTLCMRYGNGVLLFDDVVGHLNLKEARGEVRNKMVEEQNGLSKDTIKELQSLLADCWML